MRLDGADSTPPFTISQNISPPSCLPLTPTFVSGLAFSSYTHNVCFSIPRPLECGRNKKASTVPLSPKTTTSPSAPARVPAHDLDTLPSRVLFVQQCRERWYPGQVCHARAIYFEHEFPSEGLVNGCGSRAQKLTLPPDFASVPVAVKEIAFNTGSFPYPSAPYLVAKRDFYEESFRAPRRFQPSREVMDMVLLGSRIAFGQIGL
jgi:hypothetical protein